MFGFLETRSYLDSARSSTTQARHSRYQCQREVTRACATPSLNGLRSLTGISVRSFPLRPGEYLCCRFAVAGGTDFIVFFNPRFRCFSAVEFLFFHGSRASDVIVCHVRHSLNGFPNQTNRCSNNDIYKSSRTFQYLNEKRKGADLFERSIGKRSNKSVAFPALFFA